MIDSGIWRNVPFPMNIFLLPLIKGLFKTPTEGAQTSIYCAVSEEVEGVNGKYFSDCKVCIKSKFFTLCKTNKLLFRFSKLKIQILILALQFVIRSSRFSCGRKALGSHRTIGFKANGS